MKKPIQVHLVLTDKPSGLYIHKQSWNGQLQKDKTLQFSDNETFIRNIHLINSGKAATNAQDKYDFFHLYFTDDSVIKDGDWFLDIVMLKIYKCDCVKANMNGFKKITVTTNPELWYNRVLGDDIARIPASFIDAYIANPMKEVELEYEYKCENGHVMPQATGCVYPHCHSVTKLQLKLTPQGEVIWSIKQEKLYTALQAQMYAYYYNLTDVPDSFVEWFNKNYPQ